MFNFTPVLIGKLYLWAHQSLSSKASSPSHPFSLQSILDLAAQSLLPSVTAYTSIGSTVESHNQTGQHLQLSFLCCTNSY
uniref:Uncharacterized protein n=1 Tax=Anguilla anguilla TaxID=7936 RepID=A0A0E9QQG4_ANGAN